MAERRALIFANGDLGSPAVLRARLQPLRFAFVVAADGGARHAAAFGLPVDIVVGDFDSLPSTDRSRLSQSGAAFVQRPVAKDETDLELALMESVRIGATAAVVLGAVGGRLDMTLANVCLLLHPGLQGLAIQLWNGPETAYLLLPPGGDILGDVGDRVSLVPLSGEATGITTHGLEFPLTGETLPVGPARGISNRVASPHPRVELATGAVLIVHGPPPEAGRQEVPHIP
jgi:thiamine pyrophosphokinase